MRLQGGQELRAHLGQQVIVEGKVVDSGQNTIGTAGSAGQPTPSGTRSQAASDDHHSEKVKREAGRIARESMADGTAAEIHVQRVQGTGERCRPEPATRR